LLNDRYGIAHVSTGVLLRKAICERTDVGIAAEELVKDGKLVPDRMVRKIAEDEIKARDYDQFVLDGYPRTIPQAEWLTQFLSKHDAQLHRVISLIAPQDVIVDRLSKRRVDRLTRENYHLDFRPPPPDMPADRLVQREDDRPEVVLRRLLNYLDATSPVQEYYRERGLLSEVDGVGQFDEVHARIMAALAPHDTE
jgi:adenylate kinase